MIFEVEVGRDVQDIGGRFGVVEPGFATARKANVTSDSTVNAANSEISGPATVLNTPVPIKELNF